MKRLAQYLKAKASWPRRVELPFKEAMEQTGPILAKESGQVHTPEHIPDAVNMPEHMQVSPAGIALLHSFEGCARLREDGKYEAYPDPGSANGEPWTIGWGSTGPGIRPGTVWTKAQCDARFERDLERYAKSVRRFVAGTPTTQNQFDALVSFHYNTGAILHSTLGKKHKAGDYEGAAEQFGRWIYNDGKVMAGLVRRRDAERKLYEG